MNTLGRCRGLVVRAVNYGVGDPRFKSRRSQENFYSRKIIIINFFIFSEKISQWIIIEVVKLICSCIHANFYIEVKIARYYNISQGANEALISCLLLTSLPAPGILFADALA